MNDISTLYTPIQINGCIADSEGNAEQLYPRELYITKEGKLVIGNPKHSNQKSLTTISDITVENALNAKGVSFVEGSGNTSYKLSTEEKLIKGFKAEDLHIDSAILGNSTLSLDSSSNLVFKLSGTIEGGTLTNSKLQNVRLNLSSNNYGTTLPTGGNSPGDIFIVI